MRAEALPLFRRTLADSWRSLLGWAAGISAVLLLYLPLFPSFANVDVQQMMDSLPEAMVKALGYRDLTTGAGYTQSTFFGLLGFLLLTIAAVAWGSAAIAGEEESGGLDLTLAHAASRTQVVLEQTGATVVRILALIVLSAALILVLSPMAGLGIATINLLSAQAALFGLVLMSGTASLAAGAATGRKVHALAAGAGLAVVGYVLNAVAQQSARLQGLADYSPYHWAFGGSPLVNGADAAGLALLYGFSALFVGLAVLALRRRDIAC